VGDQGDRTAANLELVGGRLCLDFANTVSTRDEALRREYLTDYEQLVAWARHAHILAGDEAGTLLRTTAQQPERAAEALDRAVALRETIYRIFAAIADHREPAGPDIAALSSAVREAFFRLSIAPSAGGFEWSWVTDGDDLDRILWPVVRSAADLLTSGDLGRIRQCAREGCDWLFVDGSKNRSRRWCSMDMCGSRVKSRRYYYRRRNSG
jgi:predicted RNA-binding Zn ribbon-like protein